VSGLRGALDAVLDGALRELLVAHQPRIHGVALCVEWVSRGYRYLGAFGESRPGVSLAAGDPLHWASISKTATAVLLLQLSEQGALGSRGVDTPLAELGLFADEVLSGLHVSGSRCITLRHLLTHTAGIRDAMVDDASALSVQLAAPAPRSIVGRLLSSDPDLPSFWVPWTPLLPGQERAGTLNHYLANGLGSHPIALPGERFHYSDTGYVLLGLVIEHLSRLSLAESIRRRIAQPLGLGDLYLAYRDDPALGPAREPEAEVWVGDTPLLSNGSSLSFDWGGGGIVSSAASMSRFLRAVIGGELLGPVATAQMREWISPPGLVPPRTGVGCGLFRTAVGGRELWGHSGAWGGAMYHDPSLGLYLAGSVNQAVGGGNWHYGLVEAIGKTIAAGEP
jgi:D-alanyl-D-alanine carboxypeptidase